MMGRGARWAAAVLVVLAGAQAGSARSGVQSARPPPPHARAAAAAAPLAAAARAAAPTSHQAAEAASWAAGVAAGGGSWRTLLPTLTRAPSPSPHPRWPPPAARPVSVTGRPLSVQRLPLQASAHWRQRCRQELSAAAFRCVDARTTLAPHAARAGAADPAPARRLLRSCGVAVLCVASLLRRPLSCVRYRASMR
jgi:hypothetical protein